MTDQPSPHPPNDHPDYVSSRLRAPHRQLHPLNSVSDLRYPVVSPALVQPSDSNLTRQHSGEPVGERITVSGRIVDAFGSPIAGTLIEVWQANAAGRYAHKDDEHNAPLDPNFSGSGRCLSDADGRYHFVTIRPGAYPWGNHENAWRPAHIHFSLFGRTFSQRLVTQMYFPGDPLLALDPIFNSVPGAARERLVARWGLEMTEPLQSLGFEWNIVLAGSKATPLERYHED